MKKPQKITGAVHNPTSFCESHDKVTGVNITQFVQTHGQLILHQTSGRTKDTSPSSSLADQKPHF